MDKIDNDIYDEIRKQIAFYFSPSNIQYDKFMQRLIGYDSKKLDKDEDDCGMKPVKLLEFLRFNKIRMLTKSYDDLLNSFDKIKNNQEELEKFLLKNNLHYNYNNHTIRLIKPLELSNKDFTNRTIYIEGFNNNGLLDVDKKLRSIFEQLDTVLSVRIQQKHSKIGFAFIEFENEKFVNLLCNWYNNNDNEDLKINENDLNKLEKISKDLKQIQINNDELDNDGDYYNENKIRIISKSKWNHYKNRYLRYQRRSRLKLSKLEMELRKSFQL